MVLLQSLVIILVCCVSLLFLLELNWFLIGVPLIDLPPLLTLQLTCFAAGHATESFSDFVVGHGELWSAHLLSSAVRKVGFF